MLPRLDLARLPTPIEPMARLSERLGCEVWIKRDDLTGFGLSGNKVRKLELLLAEAVESGADTVLTCGGMQSNHWRATALAARRLGLRPVLLLRGPPPAVPDGNLLIDRLLGADLRTCTAEEYRDSRDEILAGLAAEQVAQGRVPYVIPEGGSNALGSMAFVAAAHELASQTTDDFDAIVVAVGSGGTLAGLVLGPTPGSVVGIPVCDDRATFVQRVAQIAPAAQRLGAPPLGDYGDGWSVVEGYQGRGYGLADRALWALIARVAREDGVLLDPTYTGKAMAGLVGEVTAGRLGGRVLFWHTGGAFGLFGRGMEIT